LSVLDELPQNASVVVIRLRSLGDAVLTTPALRLLKTARPDLRVSVVLDEVFAPLLESSSDIDEVIRADRKRRAQAIREIRKRHPALCLNLHGGSSSAWMTAFSGAAHRAGFAHFRMEAAYNIRIPRAQQVLGLDQDAAVHTAEHLASAMFFLGVPPQEIPAARLFAPPLERDRPYAVLHVAAAYETKQWPAERFRAIAAHVEQVHGLQPIVIAGPGQDDLLTQFPGLVTMPNLGIPQLMSLMAGADLFVGNDSGPAHIAAAFGKPCAVIFGSSNSNVWGPWKTSSQVIETAWDCKPCPGDRCYAFDQPRCILSIEEASVASAVDALLQTS
jgi:ADP-heptose:LPS heptosyltransferase